MAYQSLDLHPLPLPIDKDTARTGVRIEAKSSGSQVFGYTWASFDRAHAGILTGDHEVIHYPDLDQGGFICVRIENDTVFFNLSEVVLHTDGKALTVPMPDDNKSMDMIHVIDENEEDTKQLREDEINSGDENNSHTLGEELKTLTSKITGKRK